MIPVYRAKKHSIFMYSTSQQSDTYTAPDTEIYIPQYNSILKMRYEITNNLIHHTDEKTGYPK